MLVSMTKQNEAVENVGVTLQNIISQNMRMALAYRHESGRSLARAFGVSQGLISQQMTGRTSWTIEDMEKAGRYLGIEPAWFLRAHEISEPQLVGPVGLEPTTGGLLPTIRAVVTSLSAVHLRPRGLRGRLCICGT